MSATHWTWLLIAVATSAVILRPWRLPEALWAVAGALAATTGTTGAMAG